MYTFTSCPTCVQGIHHHMLATISFTSCPTCIQVINLPPDACNYLIKKIACRSLAVEESSPELTPNGRRLGWQTHQQRWASTTPANTTNSIHSARILNLFRLFSMSAAIKLFSLFPNNSTPNGPFFWSRQSFTVPEIYRIEAESGLKQTNPPHPEITAQPECRDCQPHVRKWKFISHAAAPSFPVELSSCQT